MGLTVHPILTGLWSATLWWLSLYALWWSFVGSWSVWAAVWGVGLAAAATVAALVGRRTSPGRLLAVADMLGDVAAALRQVVVDFALVTRVLAVAMFRGDRGPHGQFVLRRTDASGDQAAARRGWLTLAATFSPNACVVGIDPVTGEALVHDLETSRASEEPV